MCNFVLRPITSYATVDVGGDIKRGDAVVVESVTLEGGVKVGLPSGMTTVVPLNVFVHTFTANPEDIEKVRQEEYKTMGYDPKKQAKS